MPLCAPWTRSPLPSLVGVLCPHSPEDGGWSPRSAQRINLSRFGMTALSIRFPAPIGLPRARLGAGGAWAKPESGSSPYSGPYLLCGLGSPCPHPSHLCLRGPGSHALGATRVLGLQPSLFPGTINVLLNHNPLAPSAISTCHAQTTAAGPAPTPVVAHRPASGQIWTRHPAGLPQTRILGPALGRQESRARVQVLQRASGLCRGGVWGT